MAGKTINKPAEKSSESATKSDLRERDSQIRGQRERGRGRGETGGEREREAMAKAEKRELSTKIMINKCEYFPMEMPKCHHHEELTREDIHYFKRVNWQCSSTTSTNHRHRCGNSLEVEPEIVVAHVTLGGSEA